MNRELDIVVIDGRAVIPSQVKVRPGKDGRSILDDLYPLPGPAARVWEAVEPTSGAVIRFTSGTTGFPKGILQSHLHVLGKSRVHDRVLGFTDHQVAEIHDSGALEPPRKVAAE